MDSTAYNRDPLHHNAWNPLHSMTVHGIHCIQSGCFWPCCIKSTAFNHPAGIHCIQLCSINRLHSMGFHLFTLHGINCTQSRCIKSTAFNQVALGLASWNPLHSITLHGLHCIQSGCILPCCMESTAFSVAAWNALPSIGMLWAMLHKIHCI